MVSPSSILAVVNVAEDFSLAEFSLSFDVEVLDEVKDAKTIPTLDFNVFKATDKFWLNSSLRVELTKINALRSPFNCFKAVKDERLNDPALSIKLLTK